MSRLESLLRGGAEAATVRHGPCQVYVRRPPTEGRGTQGADRAAPAHGWVVLVLDDTPARRDALAKPEVRQATALSWPEVLDALEQEGVGTDFDWRPVARLPVAADGDVLSMAY